LLKNFNYQVHYVLILADGVRNTLILGQSHFREFKSALEGKPDNEKLRLTKFICSDIGEASVSFANADGGAVIIGVDDSITGIPHSEEDIQIMLNAVNTHVYQGQQLPLNNADKLILDNKTIF